MALNLQEIVSTVKIGAPLQMMQERGGKGCRQQATEEIRKQNDNLCETGAGACSETSLPLQSNCKVQHGADMHMCCGGLLLDGVQQWVQHKWRLQPLLLHAALPTHVHTR